MSAPMYKLFIEFKFIEEMSLLGLKPVVVSLQRTSVSRFYNNNGATFITAPSTSTMKQHFLLDHANTLMTPTREPGF